MKKTHDRLHVKLFRLGSRCAVGRPHTLRRPSNLLPQRARMRACLLVFARGRRARVFTIVLCMDVSCACVRAVGLFSRACVRADVSCARVTLMCVLSRACVALTSRVRVRRVRGVTSVPAR